MGVTREETIAGILSWAITAGVAIVIGACVFYALKDSKVYDVSLVSAIVAGILATIIGGFVGSFAWGTICQSLVLKAHPELSEGKFTFPFAMLIYAFGAGAVGYIFGAGVGQSKQRQ